MNKFDEWADRWAIDAWGGRAPPEVMEIAQRTELEITNRLRKEAQIHPDILAEIRMKVIDIVIGVAAEILWIERTGNYTEPWDESGFGTKCDRLNHHTNGEKT